MTVGERAEDVFYITDFEQRPLGRGGGRPGTLREKPDGRHWIAGAQHDWFGPGG